MVAAIDRTGDRRHRRGERARGGARTDRRDREQGFEEVALDRVGKPIIGKSAGVAFDVDDRVDLERHPLARRARESSRRCTAAARFRSRGRRPRRPRRLCRARPATRKFYRTSARGGRREHVEKGQRERERVGHVVGFRRAAQAEQPRHHGVDLLLARAARTDQRAFDARVPERIDRDAGLRARQAEHAARVSHQEGRSRVAIGGVELFDDDQRRSGLRDHFADARVQLAQTALRAYRRRAARRRRPRSERTRPFRRSIAPYPVVRSAGSMPRMRNGSRAVARALRRRRSVDGDRHRRPRRQRRAGRRRRPDHLAVGAGGRRVLPARDAVSVCRAASASPRTGVMPTVSGTSPETESVMRHRREPCATGRRAAPARRSSRCSLSAERSAR